MKGIDIYLLVKEKTGEDALGAPVYSENKILISDVLVFPSGSQDDADSTSLNAKTERYTLAIPKSDNHIWQDARVEFWDKKWRTVGFPKKTIDSLTPTRWNTKVEVERYEG